MNKRLDLSVSLVLLILPAILMGLTFTEQFDVPTFGGDVGPAFAPRAYFIIWFVLAALASFAAFTAEQSSAPNVDERNNQWQLAGVIAVTVGTAFAMINIGFVFATIPGFFLFCLAFGYRKLMPLALVSTLAPIVIWAVFTFVFELILPRSPWFNYL